MNEKKFFGLNFKLWGVLSFLSFFVMIYFLVLLGIDWAFYFSLDQKTEANQVHFTICETKNSQFCFRANYTYSVNGKEFSSEELLSDPVFDNPYQAKKTLIDNKKEQWTVFYPHQKPWKGTLKKSFSIKKITDSLLTMGLFLYFVFLGENQRQNRFKKSLKLFFR